MNSFELHSKLAYRETVSFVGLKPNPKTQYHARARYHKTGKPMGGD
ncbi:MAG: hypothetical protein H0T64_00530 [Pyrinomonadaceae bacterium]|nr:hypothetical protein [Pyrinomonadaceae bacterium]